MCTYSINNCPQWCKQALLVFLFAGGTWVPSKWSQGYSRVRGIGRELTILRRIPLLWHLPINLTQEQNIWKECHFDPCLCYACSRYAMHGCKLINQPHCFQQYSLPRPFVGITCPIKHCVASHILFKQRKSLSTFHTWIKQSPLLRG